IEAILRYANGRAGTEKEPVSRSRLLIIGLLGIAGIWLLWLRATNHLKPTVSSAMSSQEEFSPPTAKGATVAPEVSSPFAKNREARHSEAAAKTLAALASPITFYGVVVDQNGDRVPDAKIDYGTID